MNPNGMVSHGLNTEETRIRRRGLQFQNLIICLVPCFLRIQFVAKKLSLKGRNIP